MSVSAAAAPAEPGRVPGADRVRRGGTGKDAGLAVDIAQAAHVESPQAKVVKEFDHPVAALATTINGTDGRPGWAP
jgi:hypothetical protein